MTSAADRADVPGNFRNKPSEGPAEMGQQPNWRAIGCVSGAEQSAVLARILVFSLGNCGEFGRLRRIQPPPDRNGSTFRISCCRPPGPAVRSDSSENGV